LPNGGGKEKNIFNWCGKEMLALTSYPMKGFFAAFFSKKEVTRKAYNERPRLRTETITKLPKRHPCQTQPRRFAYLKAQ